jgi:hypothetical protein
MQKAASAALEPVWRDVTQDIGGLRRELSDQLLRSTPEIISQGSKAAQMVLWQQYRDLARQGRSDLSFADVGFRCHSQFEEDGILLYILGVIGATNRVAVEMCAGNGVQCNTANLILHHGWSGFLFDGDERLVQIGRDFYRSHRDTFLMPPRFECAWITAENVNDLLRNAGLDGPVDLLSLDLDGMDYWIWEKIEAIAPRVVVCETQNAIPAELSLTVPYDPKFVAGEPHFLGASLAAMARLGRRKGYRLVGTNRHGFNAFFLKQGVGEALLPEVSVAACLDDPCSRASRAEVWPKVKDLGWVAV